MLYSKIKDIAREKKISLKELANKIEVSETGFHQSIKSRTMRIDVLEKISSVLEVDICTFFSDKKLENKDTRELKKEITTLKTDIENKDKYIKVLEEHIETLKLLHKKGL